MELCTRAVAAPAAFPCSRVAILGRPSSADRLPLVRGSSALLDLPPVVARAAAGAIEVKQLENAEESPEKRPAEEAFAARMAGILPNAKLKAEIGAERLRRSVGIDYGLERTGIAVTFCGFAPRPHSVLKLQGDKLVEELLNIAMKEKADEFVIGLPRSWDSQETEQSKKVRIFAGKLAQFAASKGCRVFLHDEYMTTEDALQFMIDNGSTKKSRRLQIDAYAAVIILQSYFESEGRLAQLVLPKRGRLRRRLCCKYYERLNSEEICDDYDEQDEDLDFVIQ